MMGNSESMLKEASLPKSTAAFSLTLETGGPDSGGRETTEGRGFAEDVVERKDVLARYRRLREINQDLGMEVVKRAPEKTLIDWGRRLGLVRMKTFVVDGFEEMTLALDLVVYAARRGKMPPIERYRRTARFPAGSDEATILDAMCRSRFSFFAVKRRHATAGLVLDDLLQQTEIWLMDEGLEASAPEGMVIASRIIKPDVFHMTTGAAIPVGLGVMADLITGFSLRVGDSPLEDGKNVRFVEAVYAAAVASGVMGSMRFE